MKCDIIFNKLRKTGCCFKNNWILVYKLGSNKRHGNIHGVVTFGMCPMSIWGYFWERGEFERMYPPPPCLAKRYYYTVGFH